MNSGNGFIWAITYISAGATGTGGSSDFSGLSRIGDVPQIKVSADSTALFSAFAGTATGGTLQPASATVTVSTAVEGMLGFEQQAVTTSISCPGSPCSISVSFTLSFNGIFTKPIPFDAKAADMKGSLELIGVGQVHVNSRVRDPSTEEREWHVVFLSHLGNVPLLKYNVLGLVASESDATVTMDVKEEVSGRRPSIASNARSSVTIPSSKAINGQISHELNLPTGTPIHARISAWNGVGDSYGRSLFSYPALTTPVALPEKPTSVRMESYSVNEVIVEWEPPLENGGSSITECKVEWDSNSGVNEVKRITLDHSGNISGSFAITFDGQRTANLPWDLGMHQTPK